MILPIKDGVITTPFEEPRPLSVPPEQRSHVHGALDIARGTGRLDAPVDGTMQAFVFLRPPSGDWGSQEVNSVESVPFNRYWYDTFGGIISIIETKTRRRHLFTHFYIKQLQLRFAFPQEFCIESRMSERYPKFAFISFPQEVKMGDKICNMGSAGFSDAAHIHWEVHHTEHKLDPHAQRIRPEAYIV